MLKNSLNNEEVVKPAPLLELEDKASPYPIDCLPAVMRDATQAILEHVQCPDALAAFSVLGAVTHLAQTRANVTSRFHSEMPTSLFLLALGESGERKSTAYNLAIKPLAESEKVKTVKYMTEHKNWLESCGRLDGKKLKDFKAGNAEPIDPRTLIESDASFSKVTSMFAGGMPYITWSLDEGGRFFNNHNMKDEALANTAGALTKLFDNGSGERIRGTSNQDKGGRFYNRRLSIFLLAQEVAVKKQLADPVLREQGFLPRFLFAAPTSTKGSRFVDVEDSGKRPANDKRLITYWKRLEQLEAKPQKFGETGEVEAVELKLNSEANELLAVIHNKVEEQLGGHGEYSNLSAFGARATELAARVAGVFAFFNGHSEVTAETLQAANSLVEHSLGEWLRANYVAKRDTASANAYKIISWLLEKVEKGSNTNTPSRWLSFTPREWQQKGYRPLRKAAVATPLLNRLVKECYLVADETTNKLAINPWLVKQLGGATGATTATKLLKALQDGG